MDDQLEHCRNELSVYRTIEHWGLTLLVGGIGAVTYQLVQWVADSGPLKSSGWLVDIIPLSLGFFGLVFLRTINLRSSRFLRALYKEFEEAGDMKSPRGFFLGQLIAWAPLSAGTVGTMLVAYSHGTASTMQVSINWVFLLLAIIVAGVVEVVYRRKWDNSSPIERKSRP